MSDPICRVFLNDAEQLAIVSRDSGRDSTHVLSGRVYWIARHTMAALAGKRVFVGNRDPTDPGFRIYDRVKFRKERPHG